MNAVAISDKVSETADADSRVQESIEASLHDSSYYVLRSIDTEVHDGVATLQGRVGSYYLKQMAQTLVSRVPGVRQICNQLRVS